MPPIPPPRAGTADPAPSQHPPRPRQRALSQWLWDHRTVTAAGTASLVSTAVSFPLDSLKARLQVRAYPRPAVVNCARAVFAEEGIRGFTRGMCVPLATISFVRTASFSIYTSTKHLLHQHAFFPNPYAVRDVAASGALGGATSGMIISCGSAPFELVKVQRQLEYLIALQRGHAQPGSKYAMTGMQAARQIWRDHHGLRGFYLGFRLHLLRDTLGTTFYFSFYDSCRVLLARQAARQQGLQPHEMPPGPVSLWGIPAPAISFLNGSAAGIASWFIVYPLDMVKTRVQKQALGGAPPTSSVRTFLQILNAPASGQQPASLPSRFLRLYRGLGVSTLRSFLSHGITWSLIEYTTMAITRRAQRDSIPGSGVGVSIDERRALHARPDSTVLE